MRRATLILAPLLALAPWGCSFEGGKLDDLPRCETDGDCFMSSARCVEGYCVVTRAGRDAGLPPEDSGSGLDAGEATRDLGPGPQVSIEVVEAALPGDLVEARASSTVPGTYTWRVTGPDQAEVPVEPAEAGGSATFRPTRPGDYTIGLVLEDQWGRSGTSDAVVHVEGFGFSQRVGLRDVAVSGVGVYLASDGGLLGFDPSASTWSTLSDTPCRVVELGLDAAWCIPTDGDGIIRVPLDGAGPERLALPRVTKARCLATDSTGRLWIGGLGGIRLVDPGAGATLGPYVDPPGPVDDVRALAHTSYGTWLGRTTGVCLVTSPGDQRCFRELPLLLDDHMEPVDAAITGMAIDSQGRLLVATEGQGLFRLDDTRFERLFPDEPALAGALRDMARDPSGDLWVASGSGLVRLWGSPPGYMVMEVRAGEHDIGEPRGLAVTDAPRALWVAGAMGLATLSEPGSEP